MSWVMKTLLQICVLRRWRTALSGLDHFTCTTHATGFSGGSDGKDSSCDAGDPGSALGSGRSPGEENGYPLQYSCLENPTDREAWQTTVHGVAKNQT